MIFIEEYAFENVICELAGILSQPERMRETVD